MSITAEPVFQITDRCREAFPAGGSGANFHLLVESVGGVRVEPIVVPAGVSALCAGGRDGLPGLAGAVGDAGVLLELVRFEGRARLLLAAAPGINLRHNDQLAPGLVLLRDGDQISIDGGPALELAQYSRPWVGAPPAEAVGTPCPVCRLPLTAGARVFRCGVCGMLLHFEESEDDLQCALVNANCPSCTQPIRFVEGYLGDPQFLIKAEE